MFEETLDINELDQNSRILDECILYTDVPETHRMAVAASVAVVY